MSRIELSVEIEASPEEVFRYFTVEKMPLWYGAETGTTMLTCHGRGFRRGTVVQLSGRAFGREQACPAVVTEYEDGRLLAFKTVSRNMAAEISWKLEPAGDSGRNARTERTRVTMIDHFELPNPIGRLFDRIFVGPVMRANDRRFLQNLKRLAEEGAEEGGPQAGGSMAGEANPDA